MKTNRTDAEKQAWRDKMRGFVNKVGSLTPEQRSELAQRMPITTCEGHSLTAFNQVFLSMQTDIPLTVIAGFRQWKKANRQVSQGQHAAGYIYVPMGSKKDDELTDEDIHFRLVPVFDVSQTEAIFDPANEDEWNYKQSHQARNGY